MNLICKFALGSIACSFAALIAFHLVAWRAEKFEARKP
jgi:hypothetical protein